jgi:2-polyprenyl-6-methoxyphenol hydroxylase-like FAD-dependent oxidoreductase
MRIVIVGSGPAGMTAALLLARAGHEPVLVDRDPGPVPGRTWERTGVMQFHLPHGFRPQCRALLEQRLPEVYDAVLAAGADVAQVPGAPPGTTWLKVRRSVLERAFWEVVMAEPSVRRVAGRAECVVVEDGRARGVVVNGAIVPADLVIDAGGRRARLSGEHRPTERRVDCGMAYAARVYQRLPGAGAGPSTAQPAQITEHDGFNTFVFEHDASTHTVLIVRRSADRTLARLRHTAVFEAACRTLPALVPWTDPAWAQPVDRVRAGAGLTNAYRGQATRVGGLLAVGDALCTTNPQGGRGVTLGMQTAAYVADLVDLAPADRWTADLDDWGRQHLEPWFHDHVAWDHTLNRRWAGLPVDPDGPIGLDVLGAAAAVRPELESALRPYYAMVVGPDAIAPVREDVREMLRSGWQPPTPAGPTRDELVSALARMDAAA